MIRRVAAFLFGLAFAATAAAGDISPGHTIRIGGDVHATEATHGSFSAIGGQVRVDAPVDGSLHAAGGHIELGPDAQVGGNASLAGGTISVNGPIQGDLHAAGGHITIDGPVAGDAFVGGGSLVLGPHARIAGKVKFRGGELTRDAEAQVAGGVTHRAGRWQRHEPEESTFGEWFAHGWFWTAGLVVLAAFLAGALPGPSQRLTQELKERQWLTPLLGFLALTTIPVAAVLLMITIIGIPFGLMAIVLYAVLLLVGYVWLAVVLGGLLLDRFKPETAAETAWRVGAAMLTMIVLAIAVRIPLVGGLVKLAALVVGVGMIVGAVMRKVQPPATGVSASSP